MHGLRYGLTLILAMSILLLLHACGGGGGSGSGSSLPPQRPLGAVNGNAVDAVIVDGTVNVYAYQGGVRGSLLGDAVTDQEGYYSLDLRAPSQPILIEISGGSYVEEASGQSVSPEDGQVLRLLGQGMPGIGGGRSGDALVEISVRPHHLFKRDGADIRIEVPVSVQEAVLGAKIEVPTIDGPVTVSVPEGSNTGSVLRLKGKGLKCPGRARGSQFVTLKVVLPRERDEELVAFVKKWAANRPYKVRRQRADAS